MKIIGNEKDIKIHKIKNPRVKILGWVSEQEKLELLRESTFLISPSEYEGSSMSVIEAISQGVPCIVSEASSETIGIPELVMKLDDSGEWARKIISFSNYQKYEEILKKVTEQYKKYDRNSIISQWNNLYRHMIKE